MGCTTRLLLSASCFSASFSNDGFMRCNGSRRLSATSSSSSTPKCLKIYERLSSLILPSASSIVLRHPISSFHLLLPSHGSNNNNNHDGGKGGGGGNFSWGSNWNWGWQGNEENAHFVFFFCSWLLHERDSNSSVHKLRLLLLFIITGVHGFFHFQLAPAQSKEKEEGVWEVRGGKWNKIIPDSSRDEFVVAPRIGSVGAIKSLTLPSLWLQCKELFMRLMLPEGFPHSVTSDYLEYTLWRGVQGVASQISGVLATQVGLLGCFLLFHLV